MAISRTAIWLQAFRLHTLPLALAGIAMGNFIAYTSGHFSPIISLLTFVTAICLQILSNLANDYGDTKNGADNTERVGPKRAVQSGAISQRQIKGGIIVFMLLSLVSGILLLYYSLENIQYSGAMAFFMMGLLAIGAAIAYTATSNPYGYRGLGDLSVFLFFGLLAVYGAYYLQTGEWSYLPLLPAAGMGFLSAGVLNINNVRDLEADAKANKITVAVKLGLRNAKIYHWALLLGAILAFLNFYILHIHSPWQYFFLAPAILFIVNGLAVWRSHEPQEINPYLKQLVISTLIFTLSFGLGLILV